MSEIAIQGILKGVTTLADGGLRIKIDLDELQSAQWAESFGLGINYTVAIVRLADDSSQITGSGS